jgi:hypothetical protein
VNPVGALKWTNSAENHLFLYPGQNAKDGAEVTFTLVPQQS